MAVAVEGWEGWAGDRFKNPYVLRGGIGNLSRRPQGTMRKMLLTLQHLLLESFSPIQ